MQENTMIIRFIRKGSAEAVSSVTDDRVYVKRVNETRYSVKFVSGDEPTRVTGITLDAEGVESYVHTTLYLLHEDADPFIFVQFDFALMPSILFRVSKLDSAYDGILAAVKFHMDHPLDLPYQQLNEESYSPPHFHHLRTKGRHHLFLDEEC
jgi:hypothetical protein